MRILCIHQSSELYGSDRSFLTSIEALAADGHTVDVVLPGPGILVSRVQSVASQVIFRENGFLRKKLLRNPLRFICASILEFFYLLKLFFRYDAVYINTTVCFSALISCFFYSGFKVCHVREIPKPSHLLFFKILLLISRAGLIFNSNVTKRAFGLCGDVVFNGVRDPFSAGSVPIGDSRNFDSDATSRKFLFIGRFNSWKGQDLLLEAINILGSDFGDSFNVRFVGSHADGYESVSIALKRAVESSPYRSRVDIFDFAIDPSEHFLWADFIVVPSLLPEPFGRVAAEAFSYSKPVIAAEHGGLVEIIDGDLNGFFFEARSLSGLVGGLSKAIGVSDEQYRLLAANARRKYLDDFSEKSYIRSLQKIFQRFL